VSAFRAEKIETSDFSEILVLYLTTRLHNVIEYIIIIYIYYIIIEDRNLHKWASCTWNRVVNIVEGKQEWLYFP